MRNEDDSSPDPATGNAAGQAAFAIGDDDFLLGGEPFRILSGAIHYFRVHPRHWEDRIRKARQMGLNTVETYVAWNAHAPRKGGSDYRPAWTWASSWISSRPRGHVCDRPSRTVHLRRMG